MAERRAATAGRPVKEFGRNSKIGEFETESDKAYLDIIFFRDQFFDGCYYQ
jgi:hypothetical protein